MYSSFWGLLAVEEKVWRDIRRFRRRKQKNMMDKGGVTVVDVRREEEYKTGHISEAVLLTNETIGNEPPALLPDKNAVILVYCRSGVRSRQASEKLIKLGYKKVFDMGGIKDWPYDVVT